LQRKSKEDKNEASPDVKIKIGDIIDFELEKLPNLSVLMGPPQSFKTTILKLIYDIAYSSKNNVIPSELSYIYYNLTKVDPLNENAEFRLYKYEIHCSSDETRNKTCDNGKNSKDYEKFNAIFIPEEFSSIIKGFYLPFESYRDLADKLTRIYGYERTSYKMDPEEDKINDFLKKYTSFNINQIKFSQELGRFVEEVKNGKEIEVSLSSISALKARAIIDLLNVDKNKLVDKYDIILLDEPQSNIHPLGWLYLIVAIQKAISDKLSKVIIATHNTTFLSLLANSEIIFKELKLENIKAEKPNVFFMEKGRIKKEISSISMLISTYNDFIFDLYKGLLE
jgi:hypothetical protein